MNTTTRLLLTAVMCTAAVACSKKVKEVPPDDTGMTQPADTGPVTPGAYTPEDLDTDACLRQRVVYFDYDQDALRPEFQAAMGCHAKYLRDRPTSRMTLEGNADERGSREYNIALGQRRSEAVKRMLLLLGGREDQIEAVSLGEEKPRNPGHDEAAWSQNRRGDMLYQGEY